MNRSAAVIGWGKSGQGAAGALLTRGWEVSAFAARPTQTLSFDDVAGVPVHVEEDANALAAAVLDARPDLVVVSPGIPAHHPVFAACAQADIDLWGEVELARILEAAGMLPHVDFAEQRSIGALTQGRGLGAERASSDRGRPDVTIHLPGQGFLALDAKAPMDAYLRACDIEEGGEMAEARRRSELVAHAKALRSHVDALASRDYARALGASPELVILFVPSEAALSAALRADAALLDDAMARGVALCSPVTLLAVARTCATAWARTNINEQADDIIALGRDLYERLGVVAGHIENLGKSLAKSVDYYNKAVSSMENRLLSRARSVTALESASKKPMKAPEIDPDAAQVRAFTKPELTEQ